MSRYAKTTFRAINEQVRLIVEPFEALPLIARRQPIAFVCECRCEDCFASVEVTLAEYEAICADDEHRLICPGHQVAGEQVVVETPAYAVVRPAEFGEAGYLPVLEAFEAPESQDGRAVGDEKARRERRRSGTS